MQQQQNHESNTTRKSWGHLGRIFDHPAPSEADEQRQQPEPSSTLRATRPRSDSSLVKRMLPVVFIVVAISAAMAPLFVQSGYPWGTDIFKHLLKPWYMTQHFLKYHNLPQWLPYWYNGGPLWQYYPPLSYFTMFGINLAVGNIFITYKVFVVAAFLLAALITYFAFRKRIGAWSAALAGVFFALAPYNLSFAFEEGNVPRILTLVFMPLVLYLTLHVLDSGRKREVFGLSVAVFLLVLSHHMPAFMTILSLVPLVIVYAYKARSGLNRVVMVFAAYILGVGLASWWLIPAITHVDLANVPNSTLLHQQNWLYSTGSNLIDPVQRATGKFGYLGLSLVLLALWTVIKARSKFTWGLFAAALFGIFMSLGDNNLFYRAVPLDKWLSPESFIGFVSLPLALLAGMSFQYMRLRTRPLLRPLLVLLALLAVWLDVLPFLSMVRMVPQDYIQYISRHLSGDQDQGRLSVQADFMSEAAFFPTTLGGRAQSYGWASEETPHLDTINTINYAIRKGRPDYVWRNYALWDTRLVLIDRSFKDLVTYLESVGFHSVQLLGSREILKLDSPSSRVMVQDRSIIAIGRGAKGASMLFPWVSVGISQYVDDYDMQFLSQFQGILLYDYRYHSRARAETMLTELAAQGKTVIIDLIGQSGTGLFDVYPIPTTLDSAPAFQKSAEAEMFQDSAVNIGASEEGTTWMGNSFSGTDMTLISTRVQDRDYPVIGYKLVGGNKVYFSGLSLLNHAIDGNNAGAGRLVETLLDQAEPNKSIAPAPFPTMNERREDEGLFFDYSIDRPMPVVVSMTYSPHWKAQIDGKSQRLYDYENLSLLFLPEGQHSVSFNYDATPIQFVGAAVSGVFVLALLALLLPLWGVVTRLDSDRVKRLVLPVLMPSERHGSDDTTV